MPIEDMVQRFRSVGAGQVIADFNAIAAAQERMGKGGTGGGQAAIDYYGKLGSAAGTAAAALGGVAAAAATAGAWVIKGAMEEQRGIGLMNVAFRGNKEEAKKAYEWAVKWASGANPFEPGQVIATAQRMKLVTSEYQHWTELTGKLSAGMQKPMEETAMTMQKVLAGSSEGLDSLQMTYGIMRKDLRAAGWSGAMQTEQDIASVRKALESVIETRFGNAISEMGLTAAGRIATLTGSISELQKAIGRELLPEFQRSVDMANDWVTGLSRMGPEQKARVIELGKLIVVLGGVGAVFLKGVQVAAMWKMATLQRSASNIAANTAEAASAQRLAVAYTEAAAASKLIDGVGGPGLGIPGFGRGMRVLDGTRLGVFGASTMSGAPGLVGMLNKGLAPLTALINPLTLAVGAIAGFAAVFQSTVAPAAAAARASGRDLAEIMSKGKISYDPLTGRTFGPGQPLPSEAEFRQYMQSLPAEQQQKWFRENQVDVSWKGTGIGWGDYSRAYTKWLANMRTQAVGGLLPLSQITGAFAKIAPAEMAETAQQQAAIGAGIATSFGEFAGTGRYAPWNWQPPMPVKFGAGLGQTGDYIEPADAVPFLGKEWFNQQEQRSNKPRSQVMQELLETYEAQMPVTMAWALGKYQIPKQGVTEPEARAAFNQTATQLYQGRADLRNKLSQRLIAEADATVDEVGQAIEDILSGRGAQPLSALPELQKLRRDAEEEKANLTGAMGEDLAAATLRRGMARRAEDEKRALFGIEMDRLSDDIAFYDKERKFSEQWKQMGATQRAKIGGVFAKVGFDDPFLTLEESFNKGLAAWEEGRSKLTMAADKATGTYRDTLLKQLDEYEQSEQAWIMDALAKEKTKPSIAREILSTGGVSGLAEAGLSQVVSGGFFGRGIPGSRGARMLGTAQAAAIRAYSGGEAGRGTLEVRVLLDENLNAKIDNRALDTVVRVMDGATALAP